MRSLALIFGLITSASGFAQEPDPFGFVTLRPSRVISVDPVLGSAVVTIQPRIHSASAEPLTTSVDLRGAQVKIVLPTMRIKKGALADLHPGADILLSGVIALSNDLATRIVIYEPKPASDASHAMTVAKQ